MRWLRLRTIRARVVVACVLLVLLPLGTVWALGLYDAYDARAEAIRTEALGDVVTDVAAVDLPAFAERERVWVRRLDRHGQVVAQTDPRFGEGWLSEGPLRTLADFFFGPDGPPSLQDLEGDAGPVETRPEVVAALAGRAAQTLRRSANGSLVVTYRAVPVDDGAIVLAAGRRRSARSLYDSRYQLLKLSLVLGVAAIAIGWWLSRSVVRPVRSLRQRIDEHRTTGKGAPLDLPRDDEIGRLAADFESLRQRLSQQVHDTARGAADLAHELKSPVATVAAVSELVECDAPMTPERRTRIGQALRREAARMMATLDAALSLAQLSESLVDAPRSQVDMAAVARAVAEGQGLDHDEVEIVLTTHGRAIVEGVPHRLEEALRNLVTNALGFARRQVQLHVRAEDDHVRISVVDDGPGIGPGDRDRVFARFFSSRPDDHPPGSGLGLPIARAIATAHGGTLVLGPSAEAEGAAFHLTLPRVES